MCLFYLSGDISLNLLASSADPDQTAPEEQSDLVFTVWWGWLGGAMVLGKLPVPGRQFGLQ